jgi:hypothetical protein
MNPNPLYKHRNGKRKVALFTIALAFGVAIFGHPNHSHALATLPVARPVMACADLLAVDFTNVAEAPMRLDSASEVSTGVPQPYCDVVGYVAPRVRFEVRLPLNGWTQRFVMAGCGAYCGALVVSLSFNRAAFGCLPLASGEMAVANSDLGHTRGTGLANPGADGLWALWNPDGIIELAYVGMHKATVASKAVIKAFYGQAQKYSYFHGCSDGEREGLHEAQRYPDDYDGYVIGAPVIDEIATNTFYHAWNVRVNSNPDGTAILTNDKLPALNQAVLAACGKLNGGVGDMIQDFRACSFDARSITCSGADSPACLTPAQANVANLFYQGPVDESGNRLSAGDMPYGSKLAWANGLTLASGQKFSLQTSGEFQFSYDFPNYMTRFDGPTGITNQNMQFTRAQFDFLHLLQGIWDPTNPDLSDFRNKGKKLLMWQGWADSGASPRMVLDYYDAVRTQVGASTVDSFMKLYLVPGVYHCDAGPNVGNQDFLTPVMNWVEDGTPPGRVLANYRSGPIDASPVVKTRPVYPHPLIAQYVGSGDINDPNNYVSALPAVQFSDRFEWVGLSNYTPSAQKWCTLAATGTRATYECK